MIYIYILMYSRILQYYIYNIWQYPISHRTGTYRATGALDQPMCLPADFVKSNATDHDDDHHRRLAGGGPTWHILAPMFDHGLTAFCWNRMVQCIWMLWRPFKVMSNRDFATPNTLPHLISRPGSAYSPSDYSAKCSLEAILKAGGPIVQTELMLAIHHPWWMPGMGSSDCVASQDLVEVGQKGMLWNYYCAVQTTYCFSMYVTEVQVQVQVQVWRKQGPIWSCNSKPSESFGMKREGNHLHMFSDCKVCSKLFH